MRHIAPLLAFILLSACGTGVYNHQIEVTILGKLDTGKDYNRTERFAFSKGVEPKLLGVTLGSSQLQLGDW